MDAESKGIQRKEPPKEIIHSVQLGLFKRFVTNDTAEVSNTVESWESIPKYFLTTAQVEKIRKDKGHADPYEWDFIHNDKQCSVIIHPALLKQEDGSYKAFFPGFTEELVEEALKKILSEQNAGIHDTENKETWIRFSLSLVQKELKECNRSRNRNQIKHAIEVMSSCIIALHCEGKEIWRGSILQDLVSVSRKEYLDDPMAQFLARLPLFISHSINQLEFRQFNYNRLMSCNEQMTRWLYKKLIHRYKNANLMNSYHFMFSSLKGCGLLQQARERDNRIKVLSGLKELQSRHVISSYKYVEHKEGRRVIDVKYTVFPTSSFISEQKAANKRRNDNQTIAQQKGLRLVDNKP